VTVKETFRLAPPVIFWWVWVAFVALNVVDYAAQGLPSARFGAVVGAVLLLITGLAFTLALRPKVVADEDGITVLNPYRTHVVPWRLITLVDTGEWVQVHYSRTAGPEPVGPGGGGRGFAAAPGPAASSADAKKVDCWALYVSVRARRRIAAGPPRPRDPLMAGSLGVLGRVGRAARTRDELANPGYASSRVSDEAKYLASLPPAKAMAVRLDSMADRARARLDDGETQARATVTWSWTALAAAGIPAVILLAIAVA
jgi:hypothetical protein